jgi:RHS repeat-associated protein
VSGAAGDRTDAGATTGDVYDAERRLVRWTAGGVTGTEAYDGEGQRVAHQTTSGATTTTTRYISGVEEVNAASGTVTKYYPAPDGLPQAVRVGSTLSYLARDGLGSVSAALDGSGNVTAARLYAPYGQVRYNTGTLPTAKGYTGQRADAASGLNYYGARYYDPATDPFADAIANGRSAEDRTRARGTRPASHGEYVPKGAEVSQRAVQTGCSAPTRAATRSSDSRAGRRASSSMSRQQRVRLERHFSCSSSEIGGVFFRQNT